MAAIVLNAKFYANHKHLFRDLESGKNPCAFKESELGCFSVVHRYCVVCGEDRFPGNQWCQSGVDMKEKGISAVCCHEKRCQYVFFKEFIVKMIDWDKVKTVRQNFVRQYAPLMY
jgi:hypothetical protein